MLLKASRILFIALTLSVCVTIISSAGIVSYQYDTMNRVIKETYSDGNVVNYTYDEFGNRVEAYTTTLVDFGASPVSGYPPLTVAFSDMSPGQPTTWLWDFGDGTTSNQQNPSHTYTSVGSHTVSLTVSNNGQHTATRSNYIYIDTITTTITSSPAAVTNATTAGFGFNATRSDATFLCQMDTGTFLQCTSPWSYSSLSAGPHRFSVEAVGTTKYVYPSVSYGWTIDLTPPDTIITQPYPTGSMCGEFFFESTKSGSQFQCSVDNEDFSSCSKSLLLQLPS